MLNTLMIPYTAVRDLVDQGGPFVFLIFASGVLMWTLVIERIWYFTRVLPGETAELVAIWNARADHISWCARKIRQMMISRLNSAMNTNLLVMRVLVPMAPLLGLIGTVSGMLEVFDSMALRGSADARTMASGVSHAMICTMSGLAVSITGLYPVYAFTRKADHETDLLNEQFEF
jgi:biopolymer transport protein ExbB